MRSAPALLLLVSALAACGGTPAPIGLDQPFRVQGSFRSGELPGSPAPEAPVDPDAERDRPLVTNLAPPTVVLIPGQTGKVLPGRVTDDAYAIGLRFRDEGTGYWVIPVGSPDASFPGELTFSAQLDLSPELEPGEHILQLVAFDADGVAGEQLEFPLCAVRAYDKTLNACDATVLPPGAVISLTWDVDADLDLVVSTPGGKIVDADHPTTVAIEDDAQPDLNAPGVGALDRDSNGECEIDAVRRESLVFGDSPEPGTYLVYVNLFDACGKSAARFDVETYVRVRGDDAGTYDIVPWQDPISGIVLGASANGGANQGLFVGTVEFR